MIAQTLLGILSVLAYPVLFALFLLIGHPSHGTTHYLSSLEATPLETGWDDLSHLRYSLHQASSQVEVDVLVTDDVISFLLYAKAADAHAATWVRRIVDPDGHLIYDYDIDADRLNSISHLDGLRELGDVTLYLPTTPKVPLKPGRYRILLSGDSPFLDIGVLKKHASQQVQFIDLQFCNFTTTPTFMTADAKARFMSAIRHQMDKALAPLQAKVGKMSFHHATRQDIDRFEVLRINDDEIVFRALAAALRQHLGDKRAVNIAVVQDIIPATAFKVGGASLGNPGPVMVPGLAHHGIVIALEGNYRFSEQDQGINVLHEIGHLMGLTHTSEVDGRYFDIFSDTGECQESIYDQNRDGRIDDDECEQIDGRNVMFSGKGGYELSPEQRWVMQRHPFFYPSREALTKP